MQQNDLLGCLKNENKNKMLEKNITIIYGKSKHLHPDHHRQIQTRKIKFYEMK